VRAFASLPVLESEAGFLRDERETPSKLAVWAAVDVPLTDIGRVVSSFLKRFAERRPIRPQLHIVHDESMPHCILSGHQARSIGTTDRKSGDGISEIHGFGSKGVDCRSVRIRIAGVAEGLCPPLVDKHEDHVRLPPALRAESGRSSALEKDSSIHASQSKNNALRRVLDMGVKGAKPVPIRRT
jgi:hypothetical protein